MKGIKNDAIIFTNAKVDSAGDTLLCVGAFCLAAGIFLTRICPDGFRAADEGTKSVIGSLFEAVKDGVVK